MKRGWKLVGGAGLIGGAALMYLFDPDSGKRRRAVLRDGVLHRVRAAGDTLGVVSRRVANKSHALFARARSPLGTEPVSDSVLAERVRSQIGHVVTHAGAIEVAVREGSVTLTGRVLCGEIESLLKRVSRVPGVTGVENELEVCEPSAWPLQEPGTATSEAARPH